MATTDPNLPSSRPGYGWLVANLNIPSLIAIASLFYIGITTYNDVQFRMKALEVQGQERAKAVDAQFSSLSMQIQQLAAANANIPYRVTVVEEQQKQANALFETIRRDVAGLSTGMEVLSTKVGALAQKIDTQTDHRQTGELDGFVPRLGVN